MKREILFRGICTETKQWVYGTNYNDFIISYLEVDKFLDQQDLFQCNCVIRDVIPETIGQFTGLTDKNGVKVFEGDNVIIMGGLEYIVVFNSFGWCVTNGRVFYGFDQVKSEQTEIIGNIHDHAAL